MASGDRCSNVEALDKLGYSKALSEKKVERYKTISAVSADLIETIEHQELKAIVVGSRGEGTCNLFDGDVDILFVQRIVKCFENIPVPLNPKESVIFQLENENVPPGYTKIRLTSGAPIRNLPKNCKNFEFMTNLKEALVIKKGHRFLRNDQVLTPIFKQNANGMIRHQSVFKEMSGPAMTFRCYAPVLTDVSVSVDCVIALPCEYPSVVDKWCDRERLSWPNKELIERIRRLDVFLVPTGYKGSSDEELQWRISLTLAEQALVHSFNDTQIKLYVAMKMLAKHELKPICDNITSYIVKNLVFWMFENNYIEGMVRKNFDNTLIKMLKFFKWCLYWKYLPNYMNPKANMLQNKLNEFERVELIRRADDIISEIHVVLFRCPSINHVSHLSPDQLEERIAFLELAEQVVVAVLCINAKNSNLTYNIWHNESNQLSKFVTIICEAFPHFEEYSQQPCFRDLASISPFEIVNILLYGAACGYHREC